MEEKRKIFVAMDNAIDKIFNNGDSTKREDGRNELEKLRGKDSAVPFFIGYAYEMEYYYTRDIDYARKAIQEYKKIRSNGYAFLDQNIKELEEIINSHVNSGIVR